MMIMIRTTIFIGFLTLLFSTICMSDPCRFEYPGNGVIDITTLGRTDGTAAYEDRVPSKPSGYNYSYNPCKPFSKGFYCTNVAVCQISTDGMYQYNLGNQGTASWNPGNETGNVPSITYTHGVRTVIVKLQCSTTGAEEFEVLSEDPTNYYNFRLTHKCACWNGCSNTTSTTTTTVVPPSFNPCRFEYPGKGVIDFSFIGRTDEKAAYSNEPTRAASNFKYSYNPCRSFSQGSDCIGVAVCQISNEGKYTFTLGTQQSASWNLGSDLDALPSVNYAYGDRRVTVLLQCSTEGNNEFQAFGEDPINNYKFQLTHKCACWNGCSNALSTTTTTRTTTTAIKTTTSAHKPKWHMTGSLIEPRMDPTVTLLNDGKVLAVGGGTSHFLNSAESYDPATGIWTKTGSIYEERARHTASLLADGKVLVAGGTNFRREFVDSAELYDPLTGNWSATGSMNVGRFSHTAIVLSDGKVLVVGGYGDDPITVIKSLNSAELYDPITGTWSMTGSIRYARVAHIAALLLNGKVLVAGGNDGKHGDSLGSAELYDPSTGNWTVTGSLSYANQHFTASTLANGKVLVAGGLGDPVAQLYDPSTETWSPTGRMNVSRQDHTACMLKNGEVLVAGGSTYGIVTNGAELYDPSTETWRITASMNAQRVQHNACTLANGKVLVVGGMGTPDTAEVFSP